MNNNLVNFNRIQFKISTYKTATKISSRSGAIALVKAGKARCFYYKISPNTITDNLIITATLFSGHGYLFISPGEDVYKITGSINYIKTKVEIEMEKVLKVTPSERFFNGKTSEDMYVCIWGIKTSSFFIRVMMENEIEKNQNTNVIFNGKFILFIIVRSGTSRIFTIKSNN
jgi:hypothetical protein